MRVRYTKRALRQIAEALAYDAERSPKGAAKVEGRITSVLALLRMHPRAGVMTRVYGVRRVFLAPYPFLIDYDVQGEEIVVQRFRHTARRPSA